MSRGALAAEEVSSSSSDSKEENKANVSSLCIFCKIKRTFVRVSDSTFKLLPFASLFVGEETGAGLP